MVPGGEGMDWVCVMLYTRKLLRHCYVLLSVLYVLSAMWIKSTVFLIDLWRFGCFTVSGVPHSMRVCTYVRAYICICIRMYVWYIWYVSYLHVSCTCIIIYVHAPHV